MKLIVSAKKTARFVFGVSAGLVALHTIGQVSRFAFGHNYLHGFVPLFNLENELNAPSIWSFILLLTAAGLLFGVARQGAAGHLKDSGYWGGLGAVFLYLAFDELLALHELAIQPVADGLHTSGIFRYAWIFPALILVLILALAFFRFWWGLPKRTRIRFFVAGGVYVGGAVLFELPEGAIDEAGGWMNLPYTILVTIEEAMEMAGVCLFIHAVADYAARSFPTGKGAIQWRP